MSIINEALKKAGTIKQEAVERKMESAQEPPPAEKKPAARKNKKIVNKKIIFFIILITIAGAVFFIKNTRFIHEDKMAPASSTPVVAGQAQGRLALPALTLNGIVYDEERPYAIVNNKVLLKGDMVDGATLVEINQDSVKFRFNDADIELKSK